MNEGDTVSICAEQHLLSDLPFTLDIISDFSDGNFN